MQIIPQSSHLLDTDNLQLHKFSAHPKPTQYGKLQLDSVDTLGGTRRAAPLLAIPSESLTHITAFLEPTSLFALGRANKVLYEHVNDDNTWHTAFACQFLGEQPKGILLRRSEDTWKREFVLRCNLIRRWERCRNGSVSHTPHYSPIAAIHLLSDRSYGPALLSVSLQYGIVARSFPLSGKVLKGFIAASDGFGVGNGNPNAEFTPNMSSSAMTTEGWTARVAFGFSNGEVALASAMRIMESGRTANRVARCNVNEQHRGPVIDIVWDGMSFLTAGSDGDVRIWDSKRMRCICVLKDQQDLIPDPCVHVRADLSLGVALATKKSGRVVIWTGLSVPNEATDEVVIQSMLSVAPPATVADDKIEPSCFFMDRSSPPGKLCYAIQYLDDTHFFRINVDLVSGQHEVIQFGDGPLAPIQIIHPFFSSSDDGNESVILVGDALGRVSFYDWSSRPKPGQDQVSSFRRLDDDPDGIGISALACNTYVLAVGTSRGMTKIYDMLTLRLLREFTSPIPRPNTGTTAVKEIILERDLLIVAVGERVLAWEAKPVRPHKPLSVVKRGSAKGRNAKWHKRIELAQDITESRKAEEDAHAQERRSHERRRIHQAALAGLGLDEHEALQYVLMLSRDEATHQTSQGESVFEVDFDEAGDGSSVSRSSSRSEEDSASDQSPVLRPTPPLPTSSFDESLSLEAGGLNASHDSVNIAGMRMSAPPLLDDPEQFPVIASSASSLPRSSPASFSTSWSARLKTSSSTASSSAGLVAAVPMNATSMRRSVSGPALTSGPSLLSKTLHLYDQGLSAAGPSTTTAQGDADGEVDADLKLALELSLTEALSLKET